jgi:hypothetical protein
VLLNTNNGTREPAYFDTVFGILQILTGRETIDSAFFAEDWFRANARWIGLVLAVVWIGMALWSLRWIRLWQRDPARRPHGWRRIAAILVPALLDLTMLYFIFLWLPGYVETPVRDVVVRAPDLGISILIVVGLALGWGVTRTVIYIWLLFLKNRSARPTTQVAAA